MSDLAFAVEMVAEIFADNSLPIASFQDSIAAIYEHMYRNRMEHIPLVDNARLRGILAFDQVEQAFIENCHAYDKTLLPEQDMRFVYTTQHVYDAIALMTRENISLAPVLDLENNFKGCITREAAFQYISDLTAIHEPGGVIVLEVEPFNYSLREIASIIESHDARILSCYISRVPNSIHFYITLKINVSELSSIVLSFERFAYTIASTYTDPEQVSDTRSRYDALMKFLEI